MARDSEKPPAVPAIGGGKSLQAPGNGQTVSPYVPSGPASPPPKQGAMPNATVIYGIASAVIAALGLYFLINGVWLNGLLLLLLAGALFGYAMFFMRFRT
ncbi:MAG: hypothetical protein WDO70_00515 [Alphaproteobacteria bacterium]